MSTPFAEEDSQKFQQTTKQTTFVVIGALRVRYKTNIKVCALDLILKAYLFLIIGEMFGEYILRHVSITYIDC